MLNFTGVFENVLFMIMSENVSIDCIFYFEK